MRRAIALSLLLLLTLAAPAAARKTYRIDVPKTLAKRIEVAKRHTDVPILLPSRLIAERKKLYGRGTGTEEGYEFGLDAAKGCNGANACAVAFFSAVRGGEPSFTDEIELANGITGYFKPLTCGASCSPPMIEWVQDGILYTIQAQAGTKRTERRRITTLANSAIKNGPR